MITIADQAEPDRLTRAIARLVGRLVIMEEHAAAAAYYSDRMDAILKNRDPGRVPRPSPRSRDEIEARAVELVKWALEDPDQAPAPPKRGRPKKTR